MNGCDPRAIGAVHRQHPEDIGLLDGAQHWTGCLPAMPLDTRVYRHVGPESGPIIPESGPISMRLAGC